MHGGLDDSVNLGMSDCVEGKPRQCIDVTSMPNDAIGTQQNPVTHNSLGSYQTKSEMSNSLCSAYMAEVLNLE